MFCMIVMLGNIFFSTNLIQNSMAGNKITDDIYQKYFSQIDAAQI